MVLLSLVKWLVVQLFPGHLWLGVVFFIFAMKSVSFVLKTKQNNKLETDFICFKKRKKEKKKKR